MDNQHCEILIIAEHNSVHLSPDTLRTLCAARALVSFAETAQVNVAVVGHNCSKVLDELRKIDGIDNVLVADDAIYKHQLPERVASLIASLGHTFTHILAPATTFGKNPLPRIAAL